MKLKELFAARNRQSLQRRVYESIVAQARQPWFYADLAVPDTVEGRYDMIVLHSFMVLERLSGGGSAAEAFSQGLFDELFKDMDRSLREMGVGDLSVGKKVRKMAEVFYGRAEAYRSARASAEADDRTALKQSLVRNVYDNNEPPAGPDDLAGYVLEMQAGLAAQEIDTILAGDINFPPAGALKDARPSQIG